MHKSATKCNKTLSKWCKNKHGASKIIDTLEMNQGLVGTPSKTQLGPCCGLCLVAREAFFTVVDLCCGCLVAWLAAYGTSQKQLAAIRLSPQ
jgi:hypothetical protein